MNTKDGLCAILLRADIGRAASGGHKRPSFPSSNITSRTHSLNTRRTSGARAPRYMGHGRHGDAPGYPLLER
eukprot:222279-Lingulodinium_polyedra.AAC.1